MEANEAALLAICAHRCRTVDEARQRALYLRDEAMWNDEEPLHSHVVALLDSLICNGSDATAP